mmetsp:Transcript_15446/g.22710  ORF Transcript_15446/g.22710 Transcript_15446/m.22710 type:complete len:310 (-) Transcript_15446:203-1132(-)|eukprot:CAMPEP_0113948530 /NCGR_PEP_ID=MMETSP1339-20121228/70790_1 /TAXON_ID=94617 /ORGANISM="Fibrocapsa japonica" /LENGTH=309 /DNA_ID=CAMNT_0000955623 /DNA_START=61 /DNA_END=990 /DNA_ORIENTATION=- /assembly_acc=CAM_ASM_000762
MNAPEHSDIDIRLKRPDRTYRPGEIVDGVVVVTSKGSGWKHEGITMQARGSATLASTKGSGIFESISSTLPAVDLLHVEIEISSAGRVPGGVTEIPFEFVLEGLGGQMLHETYHGVYIQVLYTLEVKCRRGLISRDLSKSLEIVVETPAIASPDPTPMAFDITPTNLENLRPGILSQIPHFRVAGNIETIYCPINEPFKGEVTVLECENNVRSIELQLVRVETVTFEGQEGRESTEIQNIQIGEGDVVRNVPLSMHMVFPRLFTCSTMISQQFKVEFEINLLIIFADGYMVTENFPIALHRQKNSLVFG